MKIKRQFFFLHLYNFLFSFRIADGVWVVFLLSRGFTLAQVGVAEGVFHVVSFLCEVPSGMAADLVGRKRILEAYRHAVESRYRFFSYGDACFLERDPEAAKNID